MSKPFRVMTVRMHPNEYALLSEMARESRMSLNRYARGVLGLTASPEPTLEIAQTRPPYANLTADRRQEVLKHVISASKLGDEIVPDDGIDTTKLLD